MGSLLRYFIISFAVVVGLVSTSPGSGPVADSGKIIKITAKRFEYNPSRITLKKGAPVTLEFTSLDRLHGFNCPDLAIRADIPPGKPVRIQFTPGKTGTFQFHCDIFCGEGHENMSGEIVVIE